MHGGRSRREGGVDDVLAIRDTSILCCFCFFRTWLAGAHLSDIDLSFHRMNCRLEIPLGW